MNVGGTAFVFHAKKKDGSNTKLKAGRVAGNTNSGIERK